MRTTRGITVALLLCLLGTVPAWAKQATIVTNAGATTTGEVLAEDEKSVTLSIAGIATVFPRQDIKSLKYLLAPEEEYAQRRAKLDDGDIKGRLDLAQWLYDHNLLDLARHELTDLRQRAPDNEDVALLSRLLDKALADRAATSQPATPGVSETATPAPAPGAAAKMLTPTDINIIRIWEIDFHAQPHVTIPKALIDTLFTKYAADPAVPAGQPERDAFRALDPAAQLSVIFTLNASQQQLVKDFYGKITVADDPPVIATFRKFHQTYVVGYCGAAKCHGSPGAGKLLLFTKNTSSPQTVYTNFYILQSYATGQANMVDREHPELSLLVQFGMNQANATFPHPTTPGWRQSFATDQEPIPRMIEDWARAWRKASGTARVTYPINYSPPAPPAPAPAPPAPAPGH
jgi:hypothetical protein